LGDFIRAARDRVQPQMLGMAPGERRRVPGLRRSELATRAGISVEYLTRLEQGRDRNPSPGVVNAVADALSLDSSERDHLRNLMKITAGGVCTGSRDAEPPRREVRPAVLQTLDLLEPAVAYVTNRWGDVLAHTSGFGLVMQSSGLLDPAEPNLTRYVFTDPRARTFFLDWDQVADERASDLWLGPCLQDTQWFLDQIAPVAGDELSHRLDRHLNPPTVPLALRHPTAHELRWHRETLELSKADAQQVVVLLPADADTELAWERLRHDARSRLLHAVTG
jgi:transcriptional regulator with XRE-family HTH domain